MQTAPFPYAASPGAWQLMDDVLGKRVRNSFEALAADKRFVVVEGTGDLTRHRFHRSTACCLLASET